MWPCCTDGGSDSIADIGGGSDIEDQQYEDSETRASIDTQERRMAPKTILTRPGLLAGELA